MPAVLKRLQSRKVAKFLHLNACVAINALDLPTTGLSPLLFYSKIKAKSGEWFFEAMRAELKPLADGSTLLKRAVLETAPPSQ